MRFDFSAHAIERFQQRIRPDLGETACKALLESTQHQASKLRAKSVRGQILWRITDERCPCLLVTKQDGRMTVCVTILAADAADVPLDDVDVADVYEWEPPDAGRASAERDRLFGLVQAECAKRTKALRIAIHALHAAPTPAAEAALDQIATLDPTLLTQRFLFEKLPSCSATGIGSFPWAPRKTPSTASPWPSVSAATGPTCSRRFV